MPSQVIGLVAHAGKPGAAALVQKVLDAFAGRGVTPELETQTAALVGQQSSHTTADLGRSCDLVVVLGGDGTMLQVVHDLGSNVTPVFGINLGSLGFLTCLSSSDYNEAVDAVCSGNFSLSQRRLLQVDVERDGQLIAQRRGLNDAVISRGSLSRLIRLETRIDGGVLTEYSADGLIVATPTGSTAYSLAAGGPLIMPDSGVFVITPISPHVLTNRSMIVGDDSAIEIHPRKAEAEVFLTVDGLELQRILQGDVIRIRRAESSLPLATLPGTTFFEVLRQKLRWSGSAV